MAKQHGLKGFSLHLMASLLLFLAALKAHTAVAAPNKWTIFVYMLADNNLEQFGLMDLEEIMAGMAAEPSGLCSDSACGASCADGLVTMYITDCGGGSKRRRCCPADRYPDVLVLVDKGKGDSLYRRYFNLPNADYSVLESQWTSAKELIALPGGQWQQVTSYAELDMAKAATLEDFLHDGLTRFPPDGTRKYMLIFWDHGSGWMGYGADGTCSTLRPYVDGVYCDAATIQTLATGLAAGLKHPTTNAPIKLDIIGFDACLMAMYEVSSILAPYANHLLASELLEPGTGWDYSVLGSIVQRVTAAGTAAATTGFSEKDVADLIIQGYLATRSSGLTLALMDLTKVDPNLEGSMSSLATLLTQQLTASPALAMQLLQQRSLLGIISQAEDNVDLGALLTRFNNMATGDLKSQITTVQTAYSAAIKSYQRDGVLADGTGMAIYFPESSYYMDPDYQGFVTADQTALSGWLAFLRQLYSATGAVTSSTAGGSFGFVEDHAVPYWAVTSNTWITHGTLTSLVGLTADLMYGFISPTGTEYIVAGTTVGRIAKYAAVGAWSGQLFGLLQDLSPGDGALDGLALAYADEQRVTDSNGNVKQLILQMQVYYASSCYASISDMKQGMVKYSYTMATQATDMQLFVSTGSASKAWGEVPPAQGGVIIPYLAVIDLTGSSSSQGSSFGYSDCLKWGYEDSLMVAAFNATQAVGILGLDLTRDLATLLTAHSLDGKSKALYGAFEAAKKTQAGCQCSQLWSYTDASGQAVQVKGQCVNPDGQAMAWCQYEPESCKSTPTAVGGHNLTDYCTPTVTLSGCKCHPSWSYKGTSYYGSCASTGDPRGSWCVVDRSSCGNYRAHEWGASNTTSATINGASTQLTGLDFDYCQVTTQSGCHCSNSWDYGGSRYNGTCRSGLFGSSSVPGIDPDTNWCYVEKTCRSGHRLDGFSYDVCTPEGGRVTESGAPCQFPATYHGITIYDCINYNHSRLGATTPKSWCFTNTSTGAWSYCVPWSCSAALKLKCPAQDPASSVTGWSSPACLETLCNARRDLANISACTEDTQADRDLLQGRYNTLANSTAFGQLLNRTTGSASLDAYCSAQYGQLCLDSVLDPACPGLFRQNNVWMASYSKDLLCDTGCLRALCRMQEQAKATVTGAAAVSGNASAITCADDELTTQVMWSLMRLMDKTCGWPGPANLACNRLLSPPQLCASDTAVTAASGNITDGATTTKNYSPSTSCSWTINTPDQPYISLNFSRFDTEPMYDVVTVEDFDGLIGMFSGSDIPSSLTTDTGLIRINFTADASLQARGFAAAYLASSSPQVRMPTCARTDKLLQVVLRTRQYGSELSWVVSKRSLVSAVLGSTPSETNIVMAGGLLPASIRSKVPAAVAASADGEYKDYRSYYTYACLPTGSYSLFTFDSYGDGWEGGRITLSQVVNVTTGCVLVSDAAPAKDNKTTTFSITADADTSSSACSSLNSPDGAYYYAEAGLVIMAEDTNSFTLAKQRKLKESLAILLDVDSAQVTVQSIANATNQEVSTSQSSSTSKAAATNAARRDAAAAAASNRQDPSSAAILGVASSSNSNGNEDEGASAAGSGFGYSGPYRGSAEHAVRRLQQDNEDGPPWSEGSTSASQLPPIGSIQHMLQQQRQQGQQLFSSATAAAGIRAAATYNSKMQALSQLALSIPDLVASGVLDATQRQLLQAERALLDLQGADPSNPVAEQSHQAGTAGDGAQHAAAEEAEEAFAFAGTSGAESRKLQQQLLTLGDEGQWQEVTAAAAAAGGEGAASSDPLVAVLAEKPLGPSAGAAPSTGQAHSQLVSQLQYLLPQQPVVLLPRTVKGRPQQQPFAHVAVTQSLGEAFVRHQSAAAAPADFAGAAAAGNNSMVSIQAVPKPAPVTGIAAANDMTLSPADGFSALPHGLPFQPRVGLQTGQHNETFVVFGAARQGRTLAEAEQDREPSRDSSKAGSVSGQVLKQDGVMKGTAGLMQIDPAAVDQVIKAGRQKPEGEHRPRPGRFRPPGSRRRLHSSNNSSSSSGTTAVTGDSVEMRAQAGVRLPLPWPELQQAAHSSEAWSEEEQQPQRQLLATNATHGVTVVMRVIGYNSPAGAQAAATALDKMVANGTLSATLASQGWKGVNIGVLYTITGSVGSFWDPASWMMRIIIAAVAGAAGLMFVAGIVWWVRHRRQTGSAQVPAHAQHSRIMLGANYLPPQQAAATVGANTRISSEGTLVYPYPQGAFQRPHSPSAPLLLTPAQQSALMGGQALAPSPPSPTRPPQAYSPRAGRGSVGPYYGAYTPGMVAGPAGGSFSSPIGSPQPHVQPVAAYPVFNAPLGPLRVAGSGGSGSAVGPPVMAYPVMAPPGGGANTWSQMSPRQQQQLQQQQMWQQQQQPPWQQQQMPPWQQQR